MTKEQEAFLLGMRYASTIVLGHWNDYLAMVNQKAQAMLSSNRIQEIASTFEDDPRLFPEIRSRMTPR